MSKIEEPAATPVANEGGDGTAPEPYVLDAQIGFLLRLANQRHAAIFQTQSDMDLTPTQFAALVRLIDDGPCSQNELGRRTAMDVATIKGVVERLRDKGLVALNPDPDDKRRRTVSIARPEDELRAALHAMGRRISEETLAPLGRGERATLLRLLARLT